jgi:uncharacterized OsmC-like protein
MSTQTTTSKFVNGVNLDKLQETMEAIKESPVIAKFKFGLNNSWQDCGYNRSTIKSFYGVCEDIDHEKPFMLEADEPPILLGSEKAANPVEYLLHALASCVTTTISYHAAARGIQIQEIESRVDGDLDLQGFLGMRDDVRRGYEGIKMSIGIKADCSDEELKELYELGTKLSPVFDTVTRGVPISVVTGGK